VAPRQIKMPVKKDAEKEAEDVSAQSKRPEIGRYLLQAKGSYKTSEAAQSAAMAIKTSYYPCSSRWPETLGPRRGSPQGMKHTIVTLAGTIN
jgi:hypothetical protein